MKVALFVTCLVDQLWSAIGVSTVEVLRRVGCSVEFDGADASCLLQLGGRLSRTGSRVQVMHLAELLASRAQ